SAHHEARKGRERAREDAERQARGPGSVVQKVGQQPDEDARDGDEGGSEERERDRRREREQKRRGEREDKDRGSDHGATWTAVSVNGFMKGRTWTRARGAD